MSSLYFDARIDGAQLQQDIANINKQIGQISANMQKEGQEIDTITRRIGQGLAGAFSIFSAGAFVKDIARVRGEFQQLEVAFETMLGSKAKADQLMAEVVEFAARTPFELSDVASGAKQLLAYGLAAEDIIPTLKSLGDVSAGLSVPIERLILNYGQVRTQMRMTGRDLRDFQLQGVPIVAELAKQLDVTEVKIQEMVSAGEISFEMVEKAFKSMTDEGGRFNNLMDKQAETITGLASNFADAWDRMLNSIGQQNEGILSGSLKGAIQLVENYEEVLKILKVLVVTYGTYKAAVVATGVATRIIAQYGIYDIATKKLQAAATLKAAAAQTALNTAAKANPYGLILSAITALATVLTVYSNKTEESAKVVAEFKKNLSESTKAIKADFDAIKNANEGTSERAKFIDIANEKYKDYLPNLLNEASSLYEIEKAQNAVTTAIAKTLAFKAQEDAISNTKLNVDNQLQEFYKQIESASKKLNDAQKGQFTALIEKYKETLREQFDNLGYMPEFSINGINKIFNEISGGADLSGWAISGLDMAMKALIYSEVELQEKTNGLKTTYEEYLKALGIGQAPPEPTTITTINQKIKDTKKLLDEATLKLQKLRAPDSTASIEDIQTQENSIKELESKLAILTGISKKAQQEIEKSAKERLQALTDFADAELQLERNMQASRKQGSDRQKAETELQYQQELDRIKKQQEEYLKAWNLKQGFKPGDKGYITELPVEVLAKFDQLRIDAETQKNNRIAEINRETAREIKEIWSIATDSFLSDSEREIAAINQRYDDLIERAKKAGETDFSAINNARAKAIDEATINSGLKRLDFEQDIEIQWAEISTQGYNREIEIERKKLEIAKKFAKQKIELLKKSGTQQSKQDIEQLELFIAAIDKGLQNLNKKTLSDSLAQITQMVDEFKNLSDEIFGVDSQLSNILSGLGQMGASLTRIASGDYSGALSLITSMYKMAMNTSNVEKRLSKPWEEFEKWVSASNRELERYIKLRDDAIGWDRYTSADTAIDEMIAKIEEAENKLADMSTSFTLEGTGWFNKANREVANQLKALHDKLGGVFKEETYREWGAAFWEKVKAIYSYDLDQLLFDEAGNFTLEKINKLIDEGIITDQKVIEAVNYYEELVSKLADAEKQKQELLTATMSDRIADGIIDGFEQGYNSAADFAENFEGLMKSAILNALKIQTLEEPLKEWYRQFAAASESDNILTAEEIALLEDSYNAIIEAAQRRYEEMKRLSGLNFSADGIDQQGLSGAIKGITEETASLIAGQFYAMRETNQRQYMTGLQQLDAINQSVTHLAEIASNTRHNQKLVSIDRRLEDMNNYLKSAI